MRPHTNRRQSTFAPGSGPPATIAPSARSRGLCSYLARAHQSLTSPSAPSAPFVSESARRDRLAWRIDSTARSSSASGEVADREVPIPPPPAPPDWVLVAPVLSLARGEF